MSDVPPLPDGFQLETPDAASQPVQDQGIPALPQGFQLEQPAHANVPDVRLAADPHLSPDELQQQVATGRQEAYDQQPWYQKAAQAVQDDARLMANGGSFGFADKLAAVSDPTSQPTMLDTARAVIDRINPINAAADVISKSIVGDPNYDKNLQAQRDATQAARDRARSAALPAELTGGVLTGSALMNNGLTLAGRVAAPGVKAALTRAALSVPEGAIYGTVDALGHDTSVKKGALTGAIAGPIGSLIGDTVSTIAGKVLPVVTPSKIPDLSQLKAQAKAAYTAADNAGVIVNPQAMTRLNQDVQTALADFGYDPAIAPGVAAVVKRLDDATQNNVTLKGIDTIRKVATLARKSNNDAERTTANVVINKIDDFVSGMKPADIIAGNMKQGVTALNQARSVWTRVAKNENLVDAIEHARLIAGSTGSGGNVENATRQSLRKFIDPTSSQQMRNLTPDETKAMSEIVLGTPGQNFLRWAGKMAPTGVVSTGGSTGLGALIGSLFGPAGAAIGATTLPTVGMAAKMSADRGVANAVQALDELIRAGGTQQARQQAQAVLRSLTQAQRNAVSQIVLQGALNLNRGAEQPAH